MINELYVMTKSLKEKGLLQIALHRDISKPANSSGIYIEIDSKSMARNIEYLPKEDFSKLWKHSKGNHNSFPIIRIQKPLVQHNFTKDFDDIWKKQNTKKIEILLNLDYTKYNSNSNDILVSQWTKEQLLPLCKENSALGSLNALITRLPNDRTEQPKFYKVILELIKQQLTSFDEPMIELIKDILVGKWNKTKGEYLSGTQIAFDVYDASEFKYKVKDSKLEKVLISELNKRDNLVNASAEAEYCQLTGEYQVIEKEKYPEPKLPNLGKTYLYSNNKDIPCLIRYNLQSLQAFHVGKETITELNNTIGFLTSDYREYKTWVRVPGSKDKEVNLLIAYIESEPEIEEDLAKLMGDAPIYEQEVKRFENLGEQICKKLKEKTEHNPDAQVNVVIINKVDDGRKQVLLSERYNTNQIISGTTEWLKASENHPYIEYHIWDKKEEVIIRPQCPYPGQIVNAMKKLWKWESKNGKREFNFERTPGISIKEIYDVFIPLKNEQELCKCLLQKVYHQSQNLLISVGHYNNRKMLYEINKYAIFEHCLIISLISILLYKLKYYKEDYMHSVAFNIGRLMMLSDILHREYCLNVNPQKGGSKSGKIPPQLIGNSLLPTAAEYPNKALDLLRERIRIYKAWADTVNANEYTGIAKWAVTQMGNTSLEICKQTIPDSFNEAERVQVLLGYLAKIEKE